MQRRPVQACADVHEMACIMTQTFYTSRGLNLRLQKAFLTSLCPHSSFASFVQRQYYLSLRLDDFGGIPSIVPRSQRWIVRSEPDVGDAAKLLCMSKIVGRLNGGGMRSIIVFELKNRELLPIRIDLRGRSNPG